MKKNRLIIFSILLSTVFLQVVRAWAQLGTDPCSDGSCVPILNAPNLPDLSGPYYYPITIDNGVTVYYPVQGGSGGSTSRPNCDSQIPNGCSLVLDSNAQWFPSSTALNASTQPKFSTTTNASVVVNNLNLPQDRAQGDPINTFTGEPNFGVVDFSYHRIGFPLEYKRFYNEDVYSTLGELGKNWTSNYDWSLLSSNFNANSNNSSVTLVCPNHVFVFKPQGDGIHYIAPPGCFYRLDRVGTEIPGGASGNSFGSSGRYYPVASGNDAADTAMHEVQPSQRYRLLDKNGTAFYFGLVPLDFANTLRPIAVVDKNANAILFAYQQFRSGITAHYQWDPYCALSLLDFSLGDLICLRTNYVVNVYESTIDGMRPQKIYDSAGNWEIDYLYSNDAPIPPIAGPAFIAGGTPPNNLVPYTYVYDNRLAGRPSGIKAISNGQTLATINFNFNTADLNSPLASVDRSPSGINASYGYSVSNGNYYLTSMTDNNLPPGNRKPTFQRGNSGNLATFYGISQMPVTQVLNGRSQVAFNYQYNAISVPTRLDTLITSPTGFWENDVYVNGTWTEKDYKMDGAQYKELYSYDLNFNLNQYTDGNNHTTKMNYDEFGNLIFIQDAVGNHEVFDYDKFNQAIELKHIQDANLNDTYIDYDPYGNAVSIREPLGKTTVISYKTFGLINSITTKINATQSHVTGFEYDANGNIAVVSEPAPTGATQFFYDGKSRLVKKIDASSQPTIYQWTDQNLIKEIDLPDGTSQSFGYDGSSNLNSVQDLQNKISYIYDADDNLTDINEPGGLNTHYVYNSLCSRIGIVDPRGKATTIQYNEQNLIKHEMDPVGKSEDFSYDGAFNLKTKKDSRGITSTFDYFDNNGLKDVVFSDGTPSIAYGYDGNGNRTSMSDAEGMKVFKFDALNRLVQVQNSISGNLTVNYTYNFDSTRQSLSNPLMGTVSYAYFDNDFVKSITDQAGDSTNFSYNPLNQLSSIQYGNGVLSTFLYKQKNHLLSGLSHKNSNGELISKFNYDYDSAGNPTTLTSLEGQSTFHYDNLYRLDKAKYPGPKGSIHYGYDPAGNIAYISDEKGTNSFTADDANELQSTSTETINYDGAGNITDRISVQGHTTYQWDALNRLIKVTTPSNSQGISYIYNGDNLRVEKVNLKNGQKTRYLYDGTSVIAEIDGSTGLVIKTYNPGISSTDSNGIKQWFLTDGLGSVAGIVDSKQNLIRKYSYDAFGQAEGVSGDSNGYRYAGGSDVFSDDDTGLQYMWNRWYDPKIGRFLSKDPVVVGGAMNAYTYVDNSPLNFSDPMGLSKVPRNTSEGNFATIREMALDFTQGTLGKVNELLKGTGWVGRVNTLGGLLKNVSVFRPKVLSNLTQGILKNTGRVFTVLGGALQIGPAETRIWTSQLDFDQKLKYGSEVLGVGVVGTGVQIGASEGIEAVGLFFAPETAGGSVVAAIGINVTASYYIGKGEEWGVDKILKNAHLP